MAQMVLRKTLELCSNSLLSHFSPSSQGRSSFIICIDHVPSWAREDHSAECFIALSAPSDPEEKSSNWAKMFRVISLSLLCRNCCNNSKEIWDNGWFRVFLCVAVVVVVVFILRISMNSSTNYLTGRKTKNKTKLLITCTRDCALISHRHAKPLM